MRSADSELKHFKSLSDHRDYLDFFFEKAKETADGVGPECPFLEIGTRAGGTALILLKAIKESRYKKRILITIDPYCDVPDLEAMKVGGNGDSYSRKAMWEIAKYCYYNGLRHTHFRMTSGDFMGVFPGLKVWRDYQKFGFAYLDGSHVSAVIAMELEWVWNRVVKNGVICIDDMIGQCSEPIMQKFIDSCDMSEGNIRGFLTIK